MNLHYNEGKEEPRNEHAPSVFEDVVFIAKMSVDLMQTSMAWLGGASGRIHQRKVQQSYLWHSFGVF